jgi:uncharacterized protein
MSIESLRSNQEASSGLGLQRSLDEVKVHLEALKPTLKRRFKVETIDIFGSYVRGEQSQKSDLDLLITFSQPYSLWDLLDVKEFLSKKLRLKVDLVPKDSIKPLLKEQIIQEAMPV